MFGGSMTMFYPRNTISPTSFDGSLFVEAAAIAEVFANQPVRLENINIRADFDPRAQGLKRQEVRVWSQPPHCRFATSPRGGEMLLLSKRSPEPTDSSHI